MHQKHPPAKIAMAVLGVDSAAAGACTAPGASVDWAQAAVVAMNNSRPPIAAAAQEKRGGKSGDWSRPGSS